MRKPKKNSGMTLAELMVSVGLLSVVSLVTLQLYLSAQTEFEMASGNMTMSQRVRTTSDRIAQYLKTACPPNPQLSSTTPFYHPNFSAEPGREIYEADFVSSICFQKNALKPSAWPVTYAQSAAFVGNTDPRYIYENDVSLTAPILRYPSLYRYRVAWNPLPTTTYTFKNRTGPRSIPPRAVYIERLTYDELGEIDAVPADGPSSIMYNGVSLSNFLPDTGTPYASMTRTIIAPVVHLLSFNAYSSNVVLMRVRLYNRDPENPTRVTEGLTMNRSGFGGQRDAITRRQRYQYVEMVTNIQVPNMTMK